MSRLYDALELARKKKIMQEKPSEVPLPKIYTAQDSVHDMEEEMLSLYQNIMGLLPDIARPIILLSDPNQMKAHQQSLANWRKLRLSSLEKYLFFSSILTEQT